MRYLLVILLIAAKPLFGQVIKLNQIGFYPTGEKVAVIPITAGSPASECKIVDEGGLTVTTYPLTAAATYASSGETVQTCNFTSFTQRGRYKLVVDGIGESANFDINESVHLSVLKGGIRAFYYHRASSAITADYGGPFIRSAGHPDLNVSIHSSAASAERPAGTIISSPKGWYDAGDYNKYIVNSGITTFTLLSLYEHYPAFFNTLELKIPESGNTLPDILDETLWNLEWMLTMQDPNDGGVYHKCTSPQFSGTVMPSADLSSRVVVMKTTAAALDFAAVMATAARIFENFETEKPGFSAQCLAAAVNAWNWAKANPAVYYVQPAGIGTGTYEDNSLADEFDWASAELFITTEDATYLASEGVLASSVNIPDWKTVNGLQWVSLGLHRNLLSTAEKAAVESKILNFANTLYNAYSSSAYKTVMGPGYFYWGSNGVAGNQGFMLLQAYEVSGDEKYLRAAMGNLDYLMGKNPNGYCFMTGYGTKSPKNIHHRISASDNIAGPLPGFIVGGPNAGREDNCTYPGAATLQALSYVDSYCSWASNEIAINWNAPFVYLAGAVEAIMSNVPNGPAILVNPTDQKAQAGGQAKFTVFATGENISYQWQKDGENIVNETSAVLTLPSVSASDVATYRVLVYNTTDTLISNHVTFLLLVKAPFGGTRHAVPGIIQSEDYDEGGEGVGYHDVTPGNDGASYRAEDVDIGGTSIGWTSTNEWLNYSVTVATTSLYRMELRIASPNTNGRLTLQVDGQSVAGATNIPIPNTGGWGTFSSIYVDNISLPSGDHDFKILIAASGFNIDYVGFAYPTSIIDKQGSGISIYPNPSGDAFNLQLDAIKPGASLILTSAQGKEVLNTVISDTSFSFGQDLPQGFYIGRIVEEDKIRVFEVIKF